MPTITKKEKEEVKAPRSFKAPVKVTEQGIFLELPINIPLDCSQGELHLIMTGNVLQVSSKEPQVQIPPMNLAEDFQTPRV